ncbi:MAG TPA: RlpA-like double-psi beta-barrel domain-containing protein [Actinomycetota bacterium]
MKKALAFILLLALGTTTVSAAVRGTATFYCSDGRDGSPVSRCTRGFGPSDLVGAIDRKDSTYRKGDFVKVSHEGKSVTVLIVDTCACGGDRLIDLTIGAFQHLAPWGAGEIRVKLSNAGLPATDTQP